MSNATTYRRCRATVASRPTWENRPCGNTRGLQWDAKRGCYWCHAHRPKYITPTPKARETDTADEYESCAEYHAKHKRLPELVSAACMESINGDPDAFRARVREYAYAQSMKARETEGGGA